MVESGLATSMMPNKKYRLVLASQSPRRKELLAHLQVPFDICCPDILEHSEKSDPSDYAMDLASQKGLWVLNRRQKHDEVVLAADTIVVLNQKILEKPKDLDQARLMLMKLGGKEHIVITAVFLGIYQQRPSCFFVESKVRFSEMTEDILANYLSTRDSLDKAGAYGIQGPGLIFIDSVEGSYSSVVGLPLSHVLRELKKILNIPREENWISQFK